MSDEFVLVTKSRRKKTRKITASKISTSITCDFDLQKSIKQLETYKTQELEGCEFLEQTLKQLTEVLKDKNVKEVICLGIGKISEDIISKYQFLFILLIKEKFKIDTIKFYDPVINESDRQILESFNCEILTENKEGKYTVEEPTIFFLPHCPKQITNNLLFSNWTFDGLRNIILICNSFKSIIIANPERLLRPDAHYILEINSHTEELEIQNNFRFNDIFNDLSFHHFPSSLLPAKTSDFWKSHFEPVYLADELEFIKNDNSNKGTKGDSQ